MSIQTVPRPKMFVMPSCMAMNSDLVPPFPDPDTPRPFPKPGDKHSPGHLGDERVRLTTRFRSLRGGRVMVHPYYVMNSTASELVRLCDGQRTRAGIAQELSQADTDSVSIAADVDAFIDRLESLGLLEVGAK